MTVGRCGAPLPPGLENFPPHLPQRSIMVRHTGQMKEATRQTVIRSSDEPKLEIDDSLPIKDGVVGVVIARFAPSGERNNEVHYVVELRAVV